MNIISYAIGLNSSGGGSGGGGDAPTAEELTLTGSCKYAFYGGVFDWIINKYGNLITTNNIIKSAYMFYFTKVSSIPFTLNCSDNAYGQYDDSEAMFMHAQKLQVAPNITGYLRGVSSMFEGCLNLHAIPEYNINFDRQQYKRARQQKQLWRKGVLVLGAFPLPDYLYHWELRYSGVQPNRTQARYHYHI